MVGPLFRAINSGQLSSANRLSKINITAFVLWRIAKSYSNLHKRALENEFQVSSFGFRVRACKVSEFQVSSNGLFCFIDPWVDTVRPQANLKLKLRIVRSPDV